MASGEDKSNKQPSEDKHFPTISSAGSVEELGGQIGPYKLLSVLGEGGFGIVYLAERKRPVRRRVALKVIKPGMDSKQVIARFETEMQALALLEHPGIARVFDAGTTEAGHPYFAMEYIKGKPFTEHCDHQKLDIEERLRLFLQVCDAVQHAHQKGIIHRDIKPSNILVCRQEDKAIPKIIDFGVAKAIGQPLTERTLFTDQGQLIGTLEYMSPEQAEITNQDIDTRSDIYSLGVLLYELLTGALHFDPKTLHEAAFDEILRIIREEDPPRPSMRLSSLEELGKKVAENRRTQVVKLTKRLQKELEWIPLKAMRKERSHRYGSASELANDIRNYLNGDPLIAGPESAAYRAKKFARKHTGPIASAATILGVLLVALVVSTTMYFMAEQAREKETIARNQAEQAKNSEQEQRKLAEERSEKYRSSLYFNRINLAEKYYRESNISRVRELLGACPNDLRGWEWYYLWHISDQARMTLRGHEDIVWSVAFSPDGKRIVSGSGDKTLRVWDANSGNEERTLPGHEDVVCSVAFSPDGKRIVSGSGDNTLRVWDAKSYNEIMPPRGHEDAVWSVAFSPDGKWIVSGSGDDSLKVWDANSGSEVMALRGHVGDVRTVAFSPDGKWIVSGSHDNTLKVWDANSGSEVMTLRGHEGRVCSVVFSPDGKRIVSGSHDDTLRVWDADSGAEVMTLWGHGGRACSIVFSPDGKRIVSGGWDNTLKVWDADSGSEVRTLLEHSGYVRSVAFSPDGRRFVSGSHDDTLKVWDADSDTEPRTLRGHVGGVRTVAFSPDGRRIVSGGWDNTLKVWDANSGSEEMTLRGHDGRICSVVFSPDGKRIVSGGWDKTLKVWDANSGSELRTLLEHTGYVQSVVFSPDGRRIVSGSGDKTLKVWDANSGNEEMTLRGHEDVVWSVAFSPDGRRIVSGSHDNTLKVWDADSGSEVMTLRGHEWHVRSVAFSPDGRRIVSGDSSGLVRIWDTASPEDVAAHLKLYPSDKPYRESP